MNNNHREHFRTPVKMVILNKSYCNDLLELFQNSAVLESDIIDWQNPRQRTIRR